MQPNIIELDISKIDIYGLVGADVRMFFQNGTGPEKFIGTFGVTKDGEFYFTGLDRYYEVTGEDHLYQVRTSPPLYLLYGNSRRRLTITKDRLDIRRLIKTEK